MTPEETADTGRIVVGVDGSESSLEALAWAARQAHFTGSTLEIVTAWEWPASYGWAVPVPDDFDPEEDVRASTEAAAERVRATYPDVRIDPRVVRGHPAPILVEASKGADLLVVGSRGHGEFVGMLLGSCGEHCASHAHCPVVVFRTTP